MYKRLHSRIVVCLLFAFFCSVNVSFADEKLNISGFGRLVAGYLDDNNVSFEGYTNELTFSEQSLLAIQADYQLTDTVSVTSQLLAHNNAERDSGIEWFYLSYQPNANWLFKAGKMRTPFYHYSDVMDVGFAYAWISPPQQLYSAFLFNQYEGISGIHRFALGPVSASVELYTGSYNGDTSFQQKRYPTDIDNLRGIVLNALVGGNLKLRSSFITADFSLDLEEITTFANILRGAGFVESANSLTMEGEFDIYQAGAIYEEFDYHLAWEWMKISSKTILAPKITSYYVQGGYVFDPITVNLTFANLITSEVETANEIPFGVNPGLDQLFIAYNTTLQRTKASDLKSVTLGVRWDAGVNVAFKAEVTHYQGGIGISTFEALSESAAYAFDERANLYQIGMEFVF
ncbi:hypothetical protein [Alteromonas sp. AMM-1]|uniref:hypothetical protein n=1 Tax=Alteromonas sp. AMM-1 TaxID=3394233 RepID=UPI0039A4FD59